MFRSKLFAVLTVVLFVFGITMLDCAVAGEKIKFNGTIVTTKWQQMEVGDEEGHVIAIMESKQVYFDEKTGEKMTSIAKNIVDMNIKTGQGTIKGYGVTNYPNGDKTFRTHEGKPVGKGHWKGTWAFTGGTGKYKGVKGKGTWDQNSLAPQIDYIEIEGEMEFIATGCSGKFKDNGDGTVTDVDTGLTWQQAHVKKDWEAAIPYCEGLNHANHQDWRLPSYEELQTIVDKTKSNVMIDPIAFPETKPSLYWSATTFESNPHNAMVVDFSNGDVYSDEKIFSNYVRCIR